MAPLHSCSAHQQNSLFCHAVGTIGTGRPLPPIPVRPVPFLLILNTSPFLNNSALCLGFWEKKKIIAQSWDGESSTFLFSVCVSLEDASGQKEGIWSHTSHYFVLRL